MKRVKIIARTAAPVNGKLHKKDRRGFAAPV